MTWSIERRLGALVTVAVVVLLAVAWTGFGSVDALHRDSRRLHGVQQTLSAQQDADMEHDALHADVLTALAAGTPAESAAAVRSGIEDATTARQLMHGNAARIAALPDRRLMRDYTSARSALDSYTELAQSIVTTAIGDRPAAHARLPEFIRRFEDLETRLATITDRLKRQSDLASARADRSARRAETQTLGVGLLSLVVLGALATSTTLSVRRTLAAKRRTDEENRRVTAAARRDAEREQFRNQVADAFEMATTEADAYGVVETALPAVRPESPAELLVADSSLAHLRRAAVHPTAGEAGCGVESPWDCPAVRRGTRQVFRSSLDINACPKLRDRPAGPISAVCVPLSFMGRSLGVLHTTGPVGVVPEPTELHRLDALGTQAGTRIGTLHAMAKTQLQAATDPLTGLANRRTLEESIAALLVRGQASVAIADLDHFKRINDTHGHEAGDQALRLFARLLRRTLRPEDIAGRLGGEEFVVALPGCTEEQAEVMLGRVQAELLLELAGGQVPGFTASFGVASGHQGQLLRDVLRAADSALLVAKRSGRNRVVRAAAMPAVGTPEPAERS